MSKQSSILSFFGKLKNPPSANTSSSNTDSNVATDFNFSKGSSKENTKPVKPKFGIYDLVWARLDGYPYWPAIVCNHPSTNSFFKKVKGKEVLNVQFFDRPPQRSWIKVEDCILFENKKHPKLTEIKDDALSDAIDWAYEAMDVDKKDRSSLIVQLQVSDAEDDSMESNDDNELSPLNKSTRINKRKFDSEDEDSQQSVVKKKKQAINLILDSDSEDDYKPGKDESATSDSIISNAVLSDELSDCSYASDDDFIDDDIVDDKPAKKSTSKPKAKKKNNKKKDDNFSSDESKPATGAAAFNPATKKWLHLTFDFLKPEYIRDSNLRRPDHPDYDPKTLHVPDSFLKKQTQTQKQWWEIKKTHFDTILFFKMGKFYELFHFDAVKVCEIANILFMKGDWAHAGFPEKAYEKFADKLINLGYKVGRVEQTETAEARDSRKKEKKGENVVRREVCRITSKGTRTLNETRSVADEPYSSFILAITEKELSDNQILTGLCFVDTSIGEFHIGQLIDDKYSSLLRTIFTHYPPIEILLEKDKITSQTLQTIKSCLPNVQTSYLKSDTEFLKPRETMKLLIEGPYFKVKIEDTDKEETKIPTKFQPLLDPADVLNLTVKKDYELAFRAFGAIVYQLKRNLIEEELISLGKFNIFDTNFLLTDLKNKEKEHMVLDSVTIKNLELFENSAGGKECTLLNVLDSCATKFGKRRLRKWICSPLTVKKDIEDRQSAVKELMGLSFNDLTHDLKQLPDLERILLKIHTQSLSNRSKNHPDSRAVMMEQLSINKFKINEFCTLLESFKNCDRFVKELRNQLSDTDSGFLSNLITYQEDGGLFPNTVNVLEFFDNAFNHKIAKEKGIINPRKGVNKEYERAEANIKGVIGELDEYLKVLKRKFNCSSLSFFGTGKNRYQVEFPETLQREIDNSFETTSRRKGFVRYQDKTIRNLIARLKNFESDKEEAMNQAWRIILEAFMSHSEDWSNMIKIISILDCLISLARYANEIKATGSICKPNILDLSDNDSSVIRFSGGKHPCLNDIEFIANDLNLNGNKLMLLSGSNMSGKSTLMRQTGLLTLLAHLGSYVPADTMELSVVDRIFTRLGATDRILEGESTFYVELSETSTIIKNGTRKSLVLLDELGRGTSSVDGTAIAASVIDHIANKIQCLTMFSTHYSTLMEEFKLTETVTFGHMACMVENEDFKGPSKEAITNQTITFLYKLVEGISPKSHGFNAAKLAGIPDNVIMTGYEFSQQMEKKVESYKLLTKLLSSSLKPKEARLLLDYLVK